MVNPRSVFLILTMVFVLLLVFDWGNINKDEKTNTSVYVQNLAVNASQEKISNNELEIYVDLRDGSIKNAFIMETAERDGLYKTRLLSDDDLLRFYFRTNVSGFSGKDFVVQERLSDTLIISSIDGAGNRLEKTFKLSGGHVVDIKDKLFLSVPAYGSVNIFKTFYRNRNKSVDYGTAFSRDHLAYSTTEDVFNDEQLSSVKSREDYLGHWVGHSQKHFVVAVFDSLDNQKITLYPEDANGLFRFGFEEQMVSSEGVLESTTNLYLGPKKKEVLEKIAPHFKYNLDLGFVFGIGEFFIVVMNFLYGFVQNWGVAIVLLTILFKIVLSPLQIMQINSMVKMRRLSPRLAEIQQEYKNDQQKLAMEMTQLYRKEKFNPAAGCLPLFAQLPIFIAMFWVTREAFEFRGASFLWIPDLAESDPFLITPILMGLMMYGSQKMMPKPPQTQGMQAQIAQQMMVVFPPMITVIFLFMPAGVVIYSVINMVLSIIPQVIIMGRVQLSDGSGGGG